MRRPAQVALVALAALGLAALLFALAPGLFFPGFGPLGDPRLEDALARVAPADGATLREAFNAARDSVRFVTILSPT